MKTPIIKDWWLVLWGGQQKQVNRRKTAYLYQFKFYRHGKMFIQAMGKPGYIAKSDGFIERCTWFPTLQEAKQYISESDGLVGNDKRTDWEDVGF